MVITADFADYSSAAAPTPISVLATASSVAGAAATAASTGTPGTPRVRPYTKWYNVGERVELADFYSEMFIVPFIVVVIFIHVWGTRMNRSKAKAWSDAHATILSKEFAQVGTGGAEKSSTMVSTPAA